MNQQASGKTYEIRYEVISCEPLTATWNPVEGSGTSYTFGKGGEEYIRRQYFKLVNNENYASNAGDTPLEYSMWDAFKLAWNLKAIGGNIPDNISFDLNIGSVFVAGASMTYSVNILTRGKAGVYLTRTEQERVGGEIDWGININFSNYTGNPLNISKQTLLGPVRSISGGWGVGGNGYFGYDSKTSKVMWIGGGVGIGLTGGASYGWGRTIGSWWW